MWQRKHVYTPRSLSSLGLGFELASLVPYDFELGEGWRVLFPCNDPSIHRALPVPDTWITLAVFCRKRDSLGCTMRVLCTRWLACPSTLLSYSWYPRGEGWRRSARRGRDRWRTFAAGALVGISGTHAWGSIVDMEARSELWNRQVLDSVV